MSEVLDPRTPTLVASDPEDPDVVAAVAPRRLRYATMELARRLDARFESLRLSGRLSKWYSAVGSEATTVPAGLALGQGDALCTLHRELGAILARYLDPVRAFAGLGLVPAGTAPDSRPDPQPLLARLACQLFGKSGGFSEGVERSFHYGYLDEPAGILHVGMISHLGAMVPVAAGCAWALRQRGSDRVAINFIGDGGTSTGDFHEGLNIAAVWKLPLVLVILNNRYAFSTPTHRQYASSSLADRGPGYGIPAVSVDGNDPDAVAAVMATAVARARAGEGPTLIEAIVGRMRGHSEGDDSLKVVPPEELAAYLAADPVPAYGDRLEAEGALGARERQAILERVDQLVEAAVEVGLAAPPPALEHARRPALAPSRVRGAIEVPEPAAEISYVDAVRQALRDEMAEDPRVVLMGQDIGPFEGAFRVTRGLWSRWPERVLDTPIAESGTLGIAAGAALLGFRPVVEMQFADFVSCGFNQLVNVIAKFYYRWQIPCPVVVRLPAGGGVGAGPFHSQNPEAWFAHTAGLEVVCPATAEDAYSLLRAAIRDPNPVIFCEHKYLYRRIKGSLTGRLDAEIGRAAVRRAGTDITLIGYGASTWTCLEAATELAKRGVAAEVVDLRTLVPFDDQTVLGSVQKTGRVLIVHEAQETAGFGAEVAARIAEGAFAWLDAPVRRLGYPDRPVPYAKTLERELLPNRDQVVEIALELARY